MERIGIVFGCFIPLHKGHKRLIEDAVRENDTVIIAVCGYDDDRGKDFIPFFDRYELMCEKYKYDDKVRIVKVDDHKIGLTGSFDSKSWKIWGTELFTEYFRNYDFFKTAEVTWYTGELNYITKLSEIYKQDNFKYYGRSKVDISGTKIREDYDSYKDMVDDIFRRYLEKNEVV